MRVARRPATSAGSTGCRRRRKRPVVAAVAVDQPDHAPAAVGLDVERLANVGHLRAVRRDLRIARPLEREHVHRRKRGLCRLRTSRPKGRRAQSRSGRRHGSASRAPGYGSKRDHATLAPRFLRHRQDMLQTIHDKLKGIFAVAILVALGIVFVFWGVNFSTDSAGSRRREASRSMAARSRSRKCRGTTRTSCPACRP